MANVLFSRTSDPSSKPITDGQLIFDTSGNGKMYLDNGTERLEMGGSISVDSVLNAESTNPIQNKAVAGVMLKTLDEVNAVTKAGFITDALAAKELSNTVNTLNSNLNGFSFTTQDSKDGYMKDGEFHPFGNPYLRYNEDTGFIQMLLEDGTWKNIYCPFSLPETKRLYLVKNGKLTKNFGGFVTSPYRWSGMGGYGGSTPTFTSGDGVATYKGNGSNSMGAAFTNGTIDLSQYSSLNISVSSVSGTGYILPGITQSKGDLYPFMRVMSNISAVGTYSLDISSVIDFEYIVIATYNTNLVFGISDIWLE